MIIEKTSLEKKFNTIDPTNTGPGKILQFNNLGNLVLVDSNKQGLLAQIKVTGVSNASSVTIAPATNVVNKYAYSDFNYVVANINTTFSGGSSNVSNNALKALVESM